MFNSGHGCCECCPRIVAIGHDSCRDLFRKKIPKPQLRCSSLLIASPRVDGISMEAMYSNDIHHFTVVSRRLSEFKKARLLSRYWIGVGATCWIFEVLCCSSFASPKQRACPPRHAIGLIVRRLITQRTRSESCIQYVIVGKPKYKIFRARHDASLVNTARWVWLHKALLVGSVGYACRRRLCFANQLQHLHVEPYLPQSRKKKMH